MFYLKLFRNKDGFSIVEILISISVFVIGTVVLVTIFSRIIGWFPYISTKFEASYLAKEGIELTRNQRDENWINERDWDQGLIGSQTDNIGIFERTVSVQSVDSDILEVISNVEWTLKGDAHNVEVISRLYNWY